MGRKNAPESLVTLFWLLIKAASMVIFLWKNTLSSHYDYVYLHPSFLKCLPTAFLKILFYFYLEDNYSPLIFCEIFCFLSPTQSYLHFSKRFQQADSVDITPKPAKWGKRLSTSNGITILKQACSFSKLSLINSFYILILEKQLNTVYLLKFQGKNAELYEFWSQMWGSMKCLNKSYFDFSTTLLILGLSRRCSG